MAAGLYSHAAHPPPGCFCQEALQSRIRSSRVCTCCTWKCHLQPGHQGKGQAHVPQPPQEAASCQPPAANHGRHQLQEVPRSVHWSPAGSALFFLAPSRVGTWALRMSSSHPSASQTITQDQRPTSVELSFLPPLCIPCTYYCPIKTVLILTSLVHPLGCCDLIVFLAMSAGAPATHPSILDSEEVQRQGKGTATLPWTRLSLSCSSTLLSSHPA